MNSTKNIFSLSNLSKIFLYVLLFLLPIFIILFLAGGCSFKYMDPQYYEFKRLCKEAENVIYDEELYRLYLNAKKHISFYKGNSFYNEETGQEFFVDFFDAKHNHSKDISSKLSENVNVFYYKNEPFYKFSSFWYDDYGIFLDGDEGAGFHWKNKHTLYCKDNIIEVRK